MGEGKVGAGILNIITESLYDNPIVVFREYVQNSVDSIFKCKYVRDNCEIKIWKSNENLFFLDNANGIKRELFKDEMTKIGASTKKKQRNLGYKGIGRLSGVPYCKKLIFINLYDYVNGKAQIYTIDSGLYNITPLYNFLKNHFLFMFFLSVFMQHKQNNNYILSKITNKIRYGVAFK